MILMGAAHYPELWDSKVLTDDLTLMKKIKLNVVRVAEFTWSLIEPEEGRYDFEWLHKLVDIYGRNGIKVILGTPTAAPPPWLIKKYPEVLPVDYEGIRARYGIRREYCPNNPIYREFTKKIVYRLVKEFKDYKHVIGFQVDNEVHWGESSPWRYCYCTHCIIKFQEYLKNKYKDIDNLNNLMGTLVWSHRYRDFDEIIPPRPPFDLYNRSLAIEWLRFRSQSWVDYVKFQITIIKSIAPEKFVTTNLMGLYPEIDYYELCKDLDICSTDIYPKGIDTYDPASIALIYDATRNMNKNRKFIVMELQAGAIDGYGYILPEGLGVKKLGVAPEPGEIRKWAYQAIAHGAEGILFWNWRTNYIGKEVFWHGILDHDGIPRRRFYEINTLFNELNDLSDIISSSRIESDVAIIYSYDALWSSDIIEKGYYDHSYSDEILKVYKALWLNRINIDVVSPKADLSKYKIVVAPFIYLADDEIITNLASYVTKGGILILTPRSFVKDEYNRVRLDRRAVDDLVGAKIKEYTRVPTGTKIRIKFTDTSPIMRGEYLYGKSWLEVYEPTTANVVAHASWKWFEADPVITINNYGNGMVINLGTVISLQSMKRMLTEILNMVKVKKVVYDDHSYPEIEYYYRSLNKNEFILFIINHGSNNRKIRFTLNETLSKIDSLLPKEPSIHVERNKVELTLKGHDVRVLLLK